MQKFYFPFLDDAIISVIVTISLLIRNNKKKKIKKKGIMIHVHTFSKKREKEK